MKRFFFAATNSCYGSSANNDSITVNGLLVVQDFLTQSEESEIMEMIDGVDWVLSQSGRRKQDYGPKVNFKHKKVKTDTFVGMPEYADMLLEKMRAVSQDKLGNYIPFEMCNLEYDETKRSGIEMHFDDMWIWGNRLISINLLSGSVMTLANEKSRQLCYVWFPRRCLLCMADDVRYEWKHAIMPQHIRGRRIALTMREPSKDFQASEGGELFEKYGKQLIALSKVRVPLKKSVS
ncbi:oxidoreductase, 2OG-Fe(II) oxygenase family protein [Oesophagostomum dentatum]|uniref:Oxidoreductase, 2OG-Fe(II) oxygenase family protein n=1 Tax=Oesophagostomum dentatum TaxID=61180 RepID=A0A0B1TSY6_OESDE|nr:oxidoreductase, 2OG-Fe(II) oxygenase family protein [Oesophagostomum dentatum]